MIRQWLLPVAGIAALTIGGPASAAEWECVESSICFASDAIIHSEATPGQMLILAHDQSTGEGGWVAVDCVARLAAGDSDVMPIEDGSALAAACDTWGTEE